MVFLRKILMTTDLSPYSLAALDYVSTLSQISGVSIYLMYVAEPGHQGLPKHAQASRKKGQALNAREEAARMLAEFVARNIGSAVKVLQVVRIGSPAEEIKRFAEEQAIDLIVIATHGRSGLRRMMLGSVAQRVVRDSSVPVLTVKPADMREAILKSEDVENELHLR